MGASAFQHWRSRLLSLRWRTALLVIATLVVGGSIAILLLSHDPFGNHPASGRHFVSHRHEHNHVSSATNSVAVVVKTGATVALSGRLAALLDTSLQAVDDPLIVSDLEQTIGRHRIHDVLARFPQDMKETHADFELYRKQQEYVATGNAKGLASLSDWPVVGKKGVDQNAAWALDRYKFARMVELAIEARPDRDWYIFIEDDTYLSYSALSEFLADYDPSEPFFIGSPVRMPGIKGEPFFFGYGGSGFVLSRAVAKKWESHRYNLASRWDRTISDMWYGDFILAWVLKEELGLRLTPAWPMLNNDEPARIPFGSGTWCKPAVTLHHMRAYLFDVIYQAEKGLRSDILRFRDVFHAANPDGLPAKRDDWTNYAEDRERHEMKPASQDVDLKAPESAHNSFESCQQACQEQKRCFTFSFVTDSPLPDFEHQAYGETECHLSDVFRSGHEFKPRTVQYDDKATNTTILYQRQWASGWMTTRIDDFIEKHRYCGQ
ncbi:Glycosyltransferase family 31 protein [Teratosphaeria destructans]|uniref:N-acetylgalactosaminide beta-1,3-galactosyltransferase n=1 Tax=Teratosphaeria destructans TaxID=418781 RepID=A0A9W7SVU2_9PEZI|nr:Glycosyltransferase family 31 protein [Teratosphaeria destructans]